MSLKDGIGRDIMSSSSRGDSPPSGSARNQFIETTEKPSVFQPFKYTLATEKGLSKTRCGLCKLYYHKYSVVAKVPNHRIFDLHKQWSFAKGGRRYECPSFLYKMVVVCSFCAQFFQQVEDDPYEIKKDKTGKVIEKAVLEDKKEPIVETIDGPHAILSPTKTTFEVETELIRTDLASNGVGRAYQSSDLDNKYAFFAITPPYDKCARTRREVDPWWEIDFGRPYDIFSIDFSLLVGNFKQTITAYVHLLDRPYGFEEPFLDQMMRKAKMTKECVVNVDGTSLERQHTEHISWDLPPKTTGNVIRIQLKGILSLSIKNVSVLQGDHKVSISAMTEEDMLHSSYATLSPIILRKSLSDMMSPEKKKALIYETNNRPPILKKKRISSFHKYIKDRYRTIEMWRERATRLSCIFQREEIQQMYRIIFKYTYDMDLKNKSVAFDEEELMESCLIQFYPRCDLIELHTRLRSICRWVQTRSHLKVLGALSDAKALELVADNPTEHMYKLMTIIKRIELYFVKKMEKEKKKALAAEQEALLTLDHKKTTTASSYGSSVKIHSGTNTQELQGCSWSQFLIIMSLFCSDETHLIPHLAFNITDKIVQVDWEESSQANNTVASNTGASLGTMSLASSLMKDEMMTSVDCLPKISQQRIESLAKGKAKYIPEEFNAHTRYKNFMAEAKLDPTIPHFNSSFSEYKFEKFQRRIEFTETKFPKTLNLSFAQTLIPKRGQTSHGPVRPKKDLKYSDRPGSVAAGGEEDDEDTGSPGSRKQGGLRRHGSVSQTDSTDLYSTGNNNNLNQSSNGGLRRSPSALSIASEQTSTYDVGQDDWVDETGWDDDNNSFGSAGSLNDSYEAPKKEKVDFFCICALCDVKYPKKTCILKVMRKHIVQLRATWSSKLNSKEVSLLDNTISMYNLVRVCTYCSQFFDPDFEGGIAYPVKEGKVEKVVQGAVDAIRTQGLVPKLDKFYDSRYLEKSVIPREKDVINEPVKRGGRDPPPGPAPPMYVVPLYNGTKYVGSEVKEGKDVEVQVVSAHARHNRSASRMGSPVHPSTAPQKAGSLCINTDTVPPGTAPARYKGKGERAESPAQVGLSLDSPSQMGEAHTVEGKRDKVYKAEAIEIEEEAHTVEGMTFDYPDDTVIRVGVSRTTLSLQQPSSPGYNSHRRGGGGSPVKSPLKASFESGPLYSGPYVVPVSPVTPGKEFFGRLQTMESRTRAVRAVHISASHKAAVLAKESQSLATAKAEKRALA